MDIVFVHGKFQDHKVDLNAFNQSLIINALNHQGDAESQFKVLVYDTLYWDFIVLRSWPIYLNRKLKIEFLLSVWIILV